MSQDAWKRRQKSLPIEYPTQTQLLFKHRDATPQEVEDWYNNELKWWGDKQFKIMPGISHASFQQINYLNKVPDD